MNRKEYIQNLLKKEKDNTYSTILKEQRENYRCACK